MMRIFIHVGLVACIIYLVHIAYLTFFKGYAKTHYERSKRLFPASLIASFGQTAYITIFRLGLLFGLLVTIGVYVFILIYDIEGRLNW